MKKLASFVVCLVCLSLLPGCWGNKKQVCCPEEEEMTCCDDNQTVYQTKEVGWED